MILFLIKTSLGKRVAKPISETKNAIDVIVYTWLIYSFSDKNNMKNVQCKKNNPKMYKIYYKKLK